MHFNRKSMEDKETNKEVKELGEILAKSSIDQKRLQAQMQEEKDISRAAAGRNTLKRPHNGGRIFKQRVKLQEGVSRSW